jgi:peptidoglycan/xylan/chitin deacetylase (PgdA/CDA1 family)
MHKSFRLFTLSMLTLMLLVFSGFASSYAQSVTPFRIYLTFEDGPTDVYTPQILDILAQYNAKATFLIAGQQIAGNEELLQREIREGHAIVNHLWEETNTYAGSPDEVVIDSYMRTEEAIRAALGPELPLYDTQVKMFWQPGGGVRPLPFIENVEVITYNWHVNSDDCGWELPDTIDLDTLEFDRAVIDNVLNTPVSEGQIWNVYDYGDGVVIAMHDLNRVTPRVLPIILSELQSAGATFEALPRPWDQVGTMPVVIGVPPLEQYGIPGVILPALVLVDARVRAAPRLDGDVIGSLPVNATITVTGRANGWYRLDFDGTTGWIIGDLVKVFGPIPSLPAELA